MAMTPYARGGLGRIEAGGFPLVSRERQWDPDDWPPASSLRGFFSRRGHGAHVRRPGVLQQRGGWVESPLCERGGRDVMSSYATSMRQVRSISIYLSRPVESLEPIRP